MKKLLSILLALLLPVLAMAEGFGVIGGADGPMELIVTSDVMLPGALGEAALAAGRRVTSTLKVTELSGVELENADQTKVLTDLLKALTLVGTEQGDEEGMKLQLNGRDVLDLGVAVSGKDAYISTDLLGGTIVVNADEAEKLLSRVLDMLVKMDAMPQTEADSIISGIAMIKEIFAEAQAAPAESMDLLEELNKLDFTSLEKFIEIVQSKIVVLTELTVPRMCDTPALGVQANLTNEDMVEGMLCLCQFVLDNPSLKNYLGTQLGFPTEEQLTQIWQTGGEMYMMFGMFESEEAFRAYQQTIDSFMAALMEEIRVSKVIEGDFVITVYVDEEGPVYVTADLPVFVEAETLVETADAVQQTGRVMPINATYTRSTTAAGVAHVLKLTVDGETLTFDVLAGEDVWKMNMGMSAADGTSVKLMEVAVKTKPSDTEDGVKLTVAEATLYEGEDHPILHILLDGAEEFTDVRSYLSGKLIVTAYDYSVNLGEIEAEPGSEDLEIEIPEEIEPTATTFVLELNTDTVINGVDFSGMTKVAMEVEGIRVGIQSEFATSDPVESIMAGQVVRPAELDDSAFTKWFINALKRVNLWQANAMDALPQSMLEMILFSAEE